MRLIDADAAIEYIKKVDEDPLRILLADADAIIAFLERQETIEAEKMVHGRWERMNDEVFPYWRCTACEKVHYLEEPNADYCPGCGAKMDL